MSFFQLALAFLAGTLITTIIAWSRLRASAHQRDAAETLFASAARENQNLRRAASRANASIEGVLAAYSRPVLLTNRERIIHYANPAALELLGLPRDQVVGRGSAAVLQDYDTTQLLMRAARLGEVCERTFDRVTTGQTWRVVATPLRVNPESDEITDIALTIDDLTELRRLETVRRDFVAHVSHELRTPLAAMRLLAETLVNALDRDPAAARGFALRIAAEAEHLAQMVAELLELSRIESGKITLRTEPTDMAALIEVVIERMLPLSEERKITLTSSLPETLPDSLCDGERIGEVLINLIHNGLKYTNPGGQVTVSAAVIDDEMVVAGSGAVGHLRVKQPMLVIRVRDTGVGISDDDLPRVFERFFKADRARTRQVAVLSEQGQGQSAGSQAQAAAGTGLGLAIARHLIDLHGGRIWAESRIGRGSVFSFTLPLAPNGSSNVEPVSSPTAVVAGDN